jgi:hypothetical protein
VDDIEPVPLDPNLITLSALSWDFSPLSPVPGSISGAEAVWCVMDFHGRGFDEQVAYAVGFGQLTAEYPARMTPGTDRVRLIEERLVWIVRCQGVKHFVGHYHRGKPPNLIHTDLWVAIDGLTGERLLSPGAGWLSWQYCLVARIIVTVGLACARPR